MNRADEHEALVELIRRSASLFKYYARSEEARAIVRDLTSAMERTIARLESSKPADQSATSGIVAKGEVIDTIQHAD